MKPKFEPRTAGEGGVAPHMVNAGLVEGGGYPLEIIELFGFVAREVFAISWPLSMIKAKCLKALIFSCS